MDFPEHQNLMYKPLFWNENLFNELKNLATDSYYEETCFAIKDGKLHTLKNVSKNKELSFYLSDEDSKFVYQSDGFIHTHVNGVSIEPSDHDIKTQISVGIPFGICTVTKDSCSDVLWFGDGALEVPLIERPFIHGVYDCYSLCRSYYYQKHNTLIPDYPRQNGWWENGENLYEENFKNAGFEEVNDLKEGDAFLMKLTKSIGVFHHAAIYLGEEQILHHLTGRLSRVDKLSQWGRFIGKTVRYSK